MIEERWVCTQCPRGPLYITEHLKNVETKNSLERKAAGLEPGIHGTAV